MERLVAIHESDESPEPEHLVPHRMLSGWKRHPLIILTISVLALVAYSNSLEGSFHYDDQHTIVENRSIQTTDVSKIWKGNNRFRFLGYLSFALNYHFSGLEHMAGWHWVNIWLHILCAVLCYTGLGILVKETRSPLVNGDGPRLGHDAGDGAIVAQYLPGAAVERDQTLQLLAIPQRTGDLQTLQLISVQIDESAAVAQGTHGVEHALQQADRLPLSILISMLIGSRSPRQRQ